MKDTFTDANFPKTGDQRVYHLGTRAGEIANRIITVGHPKRARGIAENFDGGLDSTFSLQSDRGFHIYTGRLNNVPLSVISIGMGFANMDFMVREARECVQGEMAIVRLGSCGGLLKEPVGSLAIPRASVAITSNYDFNPRQTKAPQNQPYRISSAVSADPELHGAIVAGIKAARPDTYHGTVLDTTVNASADSFYSSQGRRTTFPDQNEDLIQTLLKEIEGVATLEMETFQLLHLARLWSEGVSNPALASTKPPTVPPLHDPASVEGADTTTRPPAAPAHPTPSDTTMIRAAAIHMIFASRLSQEMITPEAVEALEEWSGRAVLKAIAGFELQHVHPEEGSVWAAKA